MKKVLLSLFVLSFLISCNGPSKGPVMADQPAAELLDSKGKITTDKVDVKIEKSEGAVSVAELLANKKKYEGKTVTVTGKVTKVNMAIMGKNWIHLQDGTDFEGAYEITVTSVLEPKEGEVITLTGTIALDKDFGYGYMYDILMEDGVISE